MLKRWLRYLWANEDGFFGIGMGPNREQKSQYADTANLANFSTAEGEKDILASDQFWQAILSGDPGQISKVLGPAMSGANKRGQETKQTASQFGNRSGGTNAGMQMTDDKTRSSIDTMISQLTGTAAGTLGSTGGGLLSTGLAGHEAAFGQATTIHDENAAKWNDIFKSSMEVASSVMGGLGKGGGKAFKGMSPGQISGSFGGPTSVDTQPIDTSGWDQQL